MFRAPLRRLRPVTINAATRRAVALPRRGVSTNASPKKATWKGSAARWGAAAAALYWYNTSPLFADDPAPQTSPAPQGLNDEELVTVDKVIDRKRKEIEARAKEREAREAAAKQAEAEKEAAQQAATQQAAATEGAEAVPASDGEEGSAAGAAPAAPGSPEALEEEAGQQGAFNPETGEINWDCPCLGGMAHGPCGEEFKAAFSCFVYSKEEPKGMDCIDKFQGMQDCFRLHPEVYGAELMDDEEAEGGERPATSDAPAAADNVTPKAAVDTKTANAPAELEAATPAPAEKKAEPETKTTESAPVKEAEKAETKSQEVSA